MKQGEEGEDSERIGIKANAVSLQKLWKKQKKAEGDKMTVEEYVSLMMDAAVDAKLVPA